MTRLVWSEEAERTCENGLDRGVLYVAGYGGVPWNGLISITEKPSRNEVRKYYMDGETFLNLGTREEFDFTIEAFACPKIFELCDGYTQPVPGLYLSAQSRAVFGLSYRTVVGVDHYKLHIVYNAVAKSANRSRTTMDTNVRPVRLVWDATSKPESVSGYLSTAHFVIDTRDAYPLRVSQVEDILYGSPSNTARLPTVPELFDILGEPVDLTVTDNLDGTYTLVGPRESLVVGTNDFELTWSTAIYVDEHSYTITS